MYCQTKCKVCPSIADGKAVVRGLTLAPARLATVAQPLLAASHPVGVIETARVNGVADGRVTDEISAVFVKRVVLHLLRRPTTLQEQVLAPCVELRVVEFVRTAADFAPVLVVFLRLIWVVSLAATVAVDFPRNGGLAPPQLGGDVSLGLAFFEQGCHVTSLNGGNGYKRSFVFSCGFWNVLQHRS